MTTTEIDSDLQKKIIVNPQTMVLDLYKNIGYIVGIFLGWIIERKCIKFSTDGTTSQKIMRFLICFVIMQIMLNVFYPMIKKACVPEQSEPIISFFKTFYIICIAPAIIKFIQKKEAKKD